MNVIFESNPLPNLEPVYTFEYWSDVQVLMNV